MYFLYIPRMLYSSSLSTPEIYEYGSVLSIKSSSELKFYSQEVVQILEQWLYAGRWSVEYCVYWRTFNSISLSFTNLIIAVWRCPVLNRKWSYMFISKRWGITYVIYMTNIRRIVTLIQSVVNKIVLPTYTKINIYEIWIMQMA